MKPLLLLIVLFFQSSFLAKVLPDDYNNASKGEAFAKAVMAFLKR